jgi:hypothetical protein
MPGDRSGNVVAELNAADLAMFDRFRIGAALVAAAQIRRVTDAEARHAGFSLAIHAAADLSGLVFPYLNPLSGHAATSRLRRDRPERDGAGKVENKYVSPFGDNRHLYFPPGSQKFLADPSVPVMMAEAEKTALALAALAERCGRRMLIVATGGCWGWEGKVGLEQGPDPGERSEKRGPLPDFGLVTWPGRPTLIAFDSNVATNPKVQQARRALSGYLDELHADVRWIDIPQLQDVNGPDDYLAVAGDQAMLALLERGARPVVSLASDCAEPDAPPLFPRQAWRGVFERYRAAVSGKSEAAEAYHFVALWSVCGAALERKIWIPYFHKVYPNTYLVCIGPTADHKTSAERLAVAQAEAAGQRTIRGGGSGEGIAEELQPGPCLVFMEEISTLLRAQRWEGATLGPMLTEVFDCPDRYERRYRKNPINVERPTLSLLSASTPEWFWRDAREVDLEGGLGNRLLFFDGIPKDSVPFPGLVDVDFIGELRKVLAGTPETEAHLTDQAKALWERFYHAWRKRSQKLEPLEAAMTKRLDVYTLKLALLYARLEGTLPWIDEDQLTAAILVTNYAAGAVKRLIDLRRAGSNPAKDLESRIVMAVKNTKTLPTSRRYLHQSLSRYARSAQEFNKAFEAVERADLIRTERDGRRTLVWPAE